MFRCREEAGAKHCHGNPRMQQDKNFQLNYGEVCFYRLQTVMKISGKGRSTIYRDIKLGKFPAPYELGSCRSVGWLSTEIYEWMDSRKVKHVSPSE